MIVCIVLLSLDWLIEELHKLAGVQVFLLKWTMSECTIRQICSGLLTSFKHPCYHVIHVLLIHLF